MEILVDYELTTGTVTNPSNGLYIGTVMGLQYTAQDPTKVAAVSENKLTAQELIGLHESGLTSVEILSLRREGIL
tara:strand:+ start:1093 stop:1317 length:225 start_codon:yes stop_codon:yes gene_type:complete